MLIVKFQPLHLDFRKGVTYNNNMKQEAPISAETLTGAVIHTAEAARTRNPIIRLQTVELKRRFHDLPQLPDDCRKFGKRQNRQRYQCTQCRKVFTGAREDHLDGMYLPIEKAEIVLRMMLEGNSVSSVERITEVHTAPS